MRQPKTACQYHREMALFEFELHPVEHIRPWGEPGSQTLSWFALSLGSFHMPVGGETLFQYSPEILSHWGADEKYADYQVAAFAREMLGSAAAGAARLPERIERIAAHWDAVTAVLPVAAADNERHYAATRWVRERSPWTGYLTACPRFSFVRVGDEVFIHWDNRECSVDGVKVWTATQGTYVLSVDAFRVECHDFADRLLKAMNERLDDIVAKRAAPQIDVDLAALRQQHQTWRNEFETTLGTTYSPGIPWEVAEDAMRSIARERGIVFPI